MRVFTLRRLTCLGIMVLASGVQGCAASPGPAAATTGLSEGSVGAPTTPHAFYDDFAAALAGSASDLWLFVEGRHKAGPDLRLKGFRREGTSWHQVGPRIHGRMSAGEDLFATTVDDKDENQVPCVGFTRRHERPRVRCRLENRWQSMIRPDLADRLGSLLDLEREPSGRLVALFGRNVHGESHLELVILSAAALQRDSVTVPVARAMLGQYAAPVPGPSIALLDEGADGARSVLRREPDGWHQIGPNLEAGDGPQLTGTVTVGDTTLFPVNDAEQDPWEFSVRSSVGAESWSMVGGSPLSTGGGFAQGGLDLVDGHAWAWWRQDRPRGSAYATRIRTARYDESSGTFGSPIDVWSGETIGPGDTQIASADGQIFALYMRSAHSGSTLRATIRPVSAP